VIYYDDDDFISITNMIYVVKKNTNSNSNSVMGHASNNMGCLS